MPKKVNQVLSLIDSNREEILNLASTLVKTSSENPPGDTTKVATIIQDYLKSHGIAAETHESEKGKVNVISRIGSGRKRLIFNGHMDTVPVGDPSRWSFPPLSGKIQNDVLYGRGSVDMKGGLTAMVATQTLLSKFERRLEGSLILNAVADEETGGALGTRWLVEKGLASGDACVVGEPSNLTLCRIGEKGICFLRLKTLGVPAHGSVPMLGRNAILFMMEAIQAILKLYGERVETPLELRKVIRDSKRALVEESGVEETRKVMDRCTVNIGLIRGGTKVNVVADLCVAEVDIRVPPGTTAKEVVNRVERLMKEYVKDKVEVELVSYTDPTVTSPNERVIRILRRNARKVTGVIPSLFVQQSATDARHLRQVGVPSVSYGPGNGVKYAHAYDEQVHAEELIVAATIYALTALDYLRE